MNADTIVVAGHICLDVIPQFAATHGDVEQVLVPGKLIDVGPAMTATGGTVANVGVALHRLGAPVRLACKVGNDTFGHSIRQLLAAHGAALADGVLVSDDDETSYTVVISPPGVDRIFLHHPGANDTFVADDVPSDCFDGAGLLHFGYPPLMRSFYGDGGEQAVRLFERARSAGVTTSLDMALPDPQSAAGRVDWQAWLRRVLPSVDVFLPSLDEILFMLGRSGGAIEPMVLAEVSDRLLAWGAAVVVVKLGDQGLYLRTSASADRWANAGRMFADVADWTGRELYTPCMRVDVVGTTGSGDCTIAGALNGIARGFAPARAMQAAVAVGACNVEAADAASGIRPWTEVASRLADGWPRCEPNSAFASWAAAKTEGVLCGPNDRMSAS